MEFKDYYKNKQVVERYEQERDKGIKARVFRRLERKFVEILLSGCKKDMLEAGVGTGFITEILRKYGHLDGFDISKEMIIKTKSKFSDMKITEADILNLKLNKNYDTIISIRVISHFKFNDAKTALLNLKNHLNNNGNIIFNLENRSLTRRLLRKIMKWGSTETYQYSSNDITRLIKESGLKISKIIYLDHFFMLPLHFLNKILLSSLDNFIIKLETKLSMVRFTSNNSFIKCQKL
jgi:2-polyprenyl-3-methyl-5-hydroxy-6-metoxy-1,4-benzoquinol methylase